MFFLNKKQQNYDYFPCVALAEFFSTTLCDDLGKVSITSKHKMQFKICKSIMTNQHFNFTIEPVERFFFTLSEGSGHQTFFQHIHKREKNVSKSKKKTRKPGYAGPKFQSPYPIPFH